MIIFAGPRDDVSPTSVVAIIPARAGSKGLPNKNILEIAGLPLVEHTIKLALSVGVFDYIVVTSNSPEVHSLQTSYPGIKFLSRPENICSDTATISDAVIHAFESLTYDFGCDPAFVILQPTSPYRSKEELSSAISYAFKNKLLSMISVSKMSQNPCECVTIDGSQWQYIIQPPEGSSRRQDYSDAYFINGNFYYATLARLRQKMNKCFSDSSLWETSEPFAVDIDNSVDFELAVALFDYMTAKGFTYHSTRSNLNQ